jgi:NADPH:quinone reductase-like Zn-dependent oxidoreductase
MKAVTFDKFGDESVLKLTDAADPAPRDDEILIRVRCAGLNRADLMQRQGFYPPPPGASEILGLECAGEVIALGARVTGWRVGERAMAFLNLFQLAQVKEGESVLIHGGGSGVGTASIQLLREAHARSIVTAGSDAKCEQCLRFGADVAINYKSGPFPPRVQSATGGRGADVILDSIGAAYLMPNIEALAPGGRLVLIGLMRGTKAEIDLGLVLRRHVRIFGSTLRSRPAAEKSEIVAAFLARFGAALEAGRLCPPIYKTLPASDAPQAHRIMQASEHFGKIILRFA